MYTTINNFTRCKVKADQETLSSAVCADALMCQFVAEFFVAVFIGEVTRRDAVLSVSETGKQSNSKDLFFIIGEEEEERCMYT